MLTETFTLDIDVYLLSILVQTQSNQCTPAALGCTICFNGEIYNYKSLRNELSITDDANRSLKSDTAVLLSAIETWGVKETLQKSNGMFAFALWDNKTKKLTLARDKIRPKTLILRFFSKFFSIFHPS